MVKKVSNNKTTSIKKNKINNHNKGKNVPKEKKLNVSSQAKYNKENIKKIETKNGMHNSDKNLELREEKKKIRQDKKEIRKERKRKRKKVMRIIRLIIFVFNLYLALNIYGITQLNTDISMEQVQSELIAFEVNPENLTIPDGNKDLTINLGNPTWIPIFFPGIGIKVHQKEMEIINGNLDWFSLKPKSNKNIIVDVWVNYEEFLPLLLEKTLSGEQLDKKAQIDLFLFNKKVYTLEQNIFG